MLDREKVIKALQFCVDDIHDGGCNPDCPYFSRCAEDGGIPPIMRDALVLLKEQEPRVLSFNELEFDAVYWMERRDIRPWPVALRRMRGNPEFLVFEDYYGDMWDVSKYCVREGGWRCWTSRPTEEQRKAVAWDG